MIEGRGMAEARGHDEPWEFGFTANADGVLTREEAVYQALGAASACWENLRGAGVFRSERAVMIGQALLGALDDPEVLITADASRQMGGVDDRGAHRDPTAGTG